MAFVVASRYAAAAEPIQYGRVVRVVDGDTLYIRQQGGKDEEIRLSEIDAPEHDQPFGSEATRALKSMVAGKDVEIDVYEAGGSHDRYGRTLGRVIVNGLDVNARLVADGDAWVYRRYARDQHLYVLENAARAAQRGLWALPESERMPPWQWRRLHGVGEEHYYRAPRMRGYYH